VTEYGSVGETFAPAREDNPKTICSINYVSIIFLTTSTAEKLRPKDPNIPVGRGVMRWATWRRHAIGTVVVGSIEV